MVQLKSLGVGLTMSGDGRHDSTGPSAKYCAYTIFSGDNTKILHFNLVQVNSYINCKKYPIPSFCPLSIFPFNFHSTIIDYFGVLHIVNCTG